MDNFDSDALAERLMLVMRWKGLTGRGWAKAAGLSENAVNTFLSRQRRGKADSLKNNVLYELAVIAGVNPLWLMVGKGSPHPPKAEADPSPWRTVISSLAVAEGIPSSLVDQVQTLPVPTDDSPWYWLNAFRDLQIARNGSDPGPSRKDLLKLVGGDGDDR